MLFMLYLIILSSFFIFRRENSPSYLRGSHNDNSNVDSNMSSNHCSNIGSHVLNNNGGRISDSQQVVLSGPDPMSDPFTAHPIGRSAGLSSGRSVSSHSPHMELVRGVGVADVW